MKHHTIIFDEFYDDPYKVRDRALSQNFFYRNELTVNHPNITDEMRLDLMDNTIYCGSRAVSERDNLELLTYLKKIVQLDNIKSWFHLYVTHDEEPTNIHQDQGLSKWAGIVYLTPNPAPNSGTNIYNNNKDAFPVENVFNRLLLFDHTLYHGVGKSFGTNKYTGRLTQLFTIS